MQRTEQAWFDMDTVERYARRSSFVHGIDARVKCLVTAVYLVCLLSVDLLNVPALVPFLAYQVVVCRMGNIPIMPLVRRSLVALPFCVMIGLFNPILDHQPAFTIGGTVITCGWVSFASILLRGEFTVLASLVLIATTGFPAICSAMRRMGVPTLLTTQCLLLYRYIFLLMEDATSLSTARDLRSYGTNRTPLRFWGAMVGSLLIRSMARAERIHKAMEARGFTGALHTLHEHSLRRADLIYGGVWCIILVLLRWSDAVFYIGAQTHRLLS